MDELDALLKDLAGSVRKPVAPRKQTATESMFPAKSPTIANESMFSNSRSPTVAFDPISRGGSSSSARESAESYQYDATSKFGQQELRSPTFANPPPVAANTINRVGRQPQIPESALNAKRDSVLTIDRQPLGVVVPVQSDHSRQLPVSNLPAYRFSKTPTTESPSQNSVTSSMVMENPLKMPVTNSRPVIKQADSVGSPTQSMARNSALPSNLRNNIEPSMAFKQQSEPPKTNQTISRQPTVDRPPPAPTKEEPPAVIKEQPAAPVMRVLDLSHCMRCQGEFLPGEQKLQALGGAFHIEHFTCQHCSKSLENGTFFEYEGAPYCDKCLNETVVFPKCGFCNESIRARIIHAMGKTWHPEHFFCALCGTGLGTDAPFMEHDGKAYCETDYFNTFAPKCANCDKLITSQVINAIEKTYHEECFVCNEPTCQISLINQTKFWEHNGKPYCEQHYHAARGSLCATCQEPIIGRCLNVMGKRYHPDHFVCGYCSRPLSVSNNGGPATFKSKDGKPFCLSCFSRVF